jgi:hypothetical protein
VLVETAEADGVGRGTTEDYLRVSVPGAASRLGDTLRVHLTVDAAGALSGVPEQGAC